MSGETEVLLIGTICQFRQIEKRLPTGWKCVSDLSAKEIGQNTA
jgi:hypothetical protein